MSRLLVTLLLALCCQQLPLAGQTQAGKSIKEQLEVIRQEHAVKFVYDASLKLDMPYAGEQLQGLSLKRSLKRLFHSTGIRWSIQPNKYVLLTRVRQEAPKSCTLSGYVYDRQGETVINATVWDLTSGTGTLTNEHGFFSLTLPKGTHRVRFSCIGKGERLEELALERDLSMEVQLDDSCQLLEEVVVTADLNSPDLITQTGKRTLTARDLCTEFSLFSSPDVVKSLQGLAGVATGTELISGLYVHGGNNDQNLFLLDGTPLYQVNHLGGLFSAFNTDIVKNIDFYKSGFPARYGGRLSSVVDVRTNEGNMHEFHGSFSIGQLDGRIQLEGPIRRGRTSFNIAMRRTWLDLFTVPALAIRNHSTSDKTDMRYAFHDLNAKVTHRFSDRSRTDFSLYSGYDVFKVDNELHIWDMETDTDRFNLRWGNLTAALNWQYRFSPKIHASFTGVYTRNISRSDYLTEEKMMDGGELTGITHREQQNRSTIDDGGYRIELDYRPDNRHHLRMGSNYLLHFFRPQGTSDYDYSGDWTGVDTLRSRTARFYRGHEFSLYAEDDMPLSHWLKANLGVHYTLFHIAGKTYHSVEPRAALRYQFSERLTAKASYTEMSQFMHQLSNTYLNLPTDYWVPSTPSIRPMRSRQYAAGIYVRLPHQVRLSMEGFYKTTHHLLEYDGGNLLIPSAEEWESLVRFGRGRSYGVETEIAYDGDPLSIHAAYTLAWNKRHFPDFYSDWYADKFDNRHKLNLVLRYKFSPRFEACASWSYHSGNRMTVPQQLVHLPTLPGMGTEDETEWVYERPNNISLPAYHRLDLGMNFHKPLKRGRERIWNVGIYNAYCRWNALYGKVVQQPDGSFRGRATGVFPMITSFSYTLKF